MKHGTLFSCRKVVLAGFVLMLFAAGCIRDKYDFDKLSTQAHISPALVVPVVHGSMRMENMVEPNDTIVFDADGGVRLVFREDSIFVQDLVDLIQVDDQDPDTTHFRLGPYLLADDSSVTVVPNVVGSYDLTPLAGFHWVTVVAGRLEMTVQNNLPVQVSSLTLRLHNRSDNSVVGSNLTFTDIPAGGTATLSMNLAGESLTNELVAEIVSLSPNVALQSDAFTLTVHTYDIVGAEGNAILPGQFLYVDTGTYKLEEDTLQVTAMGLSRGVFDVSVSTTFLGDVALEVVFPSARKEGDTLRYHYLVTGGTLKDSLLFGGASFDLSTDPEQPYNALPYRYVVTLVYTGNYVDFSTTDLFYVRYQIRDVTLDYAEGYFGEQEASFDGDTIETGMEEVFSHIHGTLSLTNPQVKIFYSNGFGIPVEITADITGVDGEGREQSLNAPPMRMDYPVVREDPPAEGVLAFTRDNTNIVELIDLRPLTIIYGGGARMNPDGFQGWDNFISASSSLVAGLEVDVPLEIRLQNLVLSDTLENPLQNEDADTSEFSLKDLDYLMLYLGTDNGFPMDLSIRMYMYDSLTHVVSDSVLFGKILEAAPVDAGGRVTETVTTKQQVRIEGSQLEALETANALILVVTFNTSGAGTQDVKIYTDYTLGFRLAVATALDYDFDMGE